MVSRYTKTFAAAILAVFIGMSGQAFAGTGGGGLIVPGVPKIKDVICLSGCNKIRQSSPGGTVQITGSGLGRVDTVNFPGKTKRILVEPSSASAGRLVAKVPKGAITGRLRVRSSTGSTSSPSDAVLEIGPVPSPEPAPLRLIDASTSPRVAYQFGAKRPRLNFVIGGGKRQNDLRIDIVAASGDVVASRIKKGVERGSSQRLTWNGKRGGKPAPNGRYHFVVRSIDGSAAVLSKSLSRTTRKASRSRAAANPFAFAIYGYMFPVRGPHSYGDGVGAGRGHQGQDVLANCGTPIVAARGGTVYYNSYQAGGAGNYLVIDIAGTRGKSQVYMHLPKQSRFKVGSRVKTGQRIGVVGSTGRSTACHLHFEEWSSPGWYQGGTFLSPTAMLKRWDRYS